MKTLGKVFQNEDLFIIVHRCMNHNKKPKFIEIYKSRDLFSIDLSTLFGKFQEHEMKLKRLDDDEESD